MAAVENHLKRKLEAGGLAASLNLVHWRSVNAAGIAQECGFDWLFLDLEHNTMDLDTAAQICVAALPTGVTPIVRVPSHDSFQATRILDGGAMGIVVPHVDTPEQAANLRARAELMQKITAIVKESSWTQSEAARRCGVTQPRINDLLQGRVSRFSLDALVNIATAIGRRVHIELDAA